MLTRRFLLLGALLLVAAPLAAQESTGAADTGGPTAYQIHVVVPVSALDTARGAARTAWRDEAIATDTSGDTALTAEETWGTFSDDGVTCKVPLSATGSAPATHCGTSWWATTALRDRLAVRFDSAVIISGAGYSERAAAQSTPTFDDLLSAMGLQRIPPGG